MCVDTYAQGPPAGAPSGVGATTNSSYVPPDTSLLVYYIASRPEIAYPMEGEPLNRTLYMVDPARSGLVDYANLGNIGSSARPLFYETNWRKGFDIGARPFDVYKQKSGDLRHIWSQGAYSNVQYALGRGQSEGTFSGQYGRTFSDSINFSLDYRGINHAGQFQYQRVKHNSLSMGLWLPKKKRWQGFIQFTQNIFRQQDNGGILAVTTALDPSLLSGAIGIPINLSDKSALSRLADWTLLGTQHYDLIGKAGGRKLSLLHEIAWSKERYHFLDDAAGTADSIFLGSDFYVDFRGIRNYWRSSKLENKFTLRTFKVRSGGGNDQLNVGIEHGFWNVQHGNLDSNFNQLFATGKLGLQLKETLNLQARAAWNIANPLEYNIEGTVSWKVGKAGIVEGMLLQQRVQPFALQNNLSLSQRSIWSHDFGKIFETKIAGSYALPRIGFKTTVQNHIIDNFIYFDELAKPSQISAPITISQLLVQENFKIGVFGVENTLALQTTNNKTVLRLPDWYYRGSLYAEHNAFKKRMLLRTGAELRTNASFMGDNYMPVTWQFYIQNDAELPTYAHLDLYLAFKIKDFRFFVRYENLGNLLWTNNFYFLTANYPQAPKQLRLSIAWRFRDQ